MRKYWSLEEALTALSKLTPGKKPSWGEMSAQRMVEHLTDTLRIATGKNPQTIQIPEDKVERMQGFSSFGQTDGEKYRSSFREENEKLRHSELELAIDEFTDEWLEFDEIFSDNENHTSIHPFYGALNYEQWNLLNGKHLNHHFEQFQIA